MPQKIRNDQTGETFEWVGGRGWQKLYENMPQPGPLETVAIQAGGELTNMARGLGGLLGVDESAEAGGERELMAGLARERPVSSFAGRALPWLATAPLGSGAGAAQMLPKVLMRGVRIPGGMAAEQAALGMGLGAALTPGGFGERATAGTIGAVSALAGQQMGALITAGARRAFPGRQVAAEVVPDEEIAAMQAAVREMDPAVLRTTPAPSKGYERQRLEGRADELGLWLTPADRLNSQSGKLWEAATESHPMTAALIEPFRENNRAVMGRMALRAIGEPEPHVSKRVVEISPADIGAANTRLAREFEAIEEALPGRLQMDNALRLDLLGIGERASKGWPKRPEVTETVANGIREWGRPFRGKDLMEARRRLTQDVQRARVDGDAYKIQSLKEMIDAVDKFVVRVSDEPTGARYATARDQWRALQTLESPGVINERREVVGKALYRQLEADYPAEFQRGNMYGNATEPMLDLFDSARVLGMFGDVVGNSGTATRQAMSEFMKGPTVLGAVMIGGREVVRRGVRGAYKAGAVDAVPKIKDAYREALNSAFAKAAADAARASAGADSDELRGARP